MQIIIIIVVMYYERINANCEAVQINWFLYANSEVSRHDKFHNIVFDSAVGSCNKAFLITKTIKNS